jgi:hypothetical protein
MKKDIQDIKEAIEIKDILEEIIIPFSKFNKDNQKEGLEFSD